VAQTSIIPPTIPWTCCLVYVREYIKNLRLVVVVDPSPTTESHTTSFFGSRNFRRIYHCEILQLPAVIPIFSRPTNEHTVMAIPPPAPAFCTNVSPECPIEGTLYGYYPSIGWNGFFAGFFALCTIINIVLGFKYKTWSFMAAMTIGCLGEVIGYAGRIMMWDNPFDETGFQMQICCLIIAPAFISAAIYLTLKHIVLSFGEDWARLPPSWYTWVFIGCDLLSLILQGAGGGIAATADFGSDMQDIGTDLMIAGVVWQVVCLSFFGYLLGEYALRTYRHRNELMPDAIRLLKDIKFRLFIGGIVTAYVTILARCAYRIPELTGGWRSELMRDEPEFIVLEGVMIVVAVTALTVFHPGYCFPALAANKPNPRPKSMDGSMEMQSLA
jgi:hypothetical protein